MQTQWSLKKKSGDVTGHASPMDEWLKGSAASAQEDENGKDEKLSSILQKAYAGKKLQMISLENAKCEKLERSTQA